MNEDNKKKGKKYLVIGVLILFLSVLGVSVAYYLARVQATLSGRAAGTELTINVEKLSTSANMDLIPLDNDLETLNQAAVGYQDKGACVDINGYSVCQIYKVTVTNNGSVPLTVNGTVTLSGQNVPNIDCARMDNATTVANNNSCKSGMFVSEDTLNANDSNDYYVMIYINNLDEPQTDSGEFNGTITFTTDDGKQVKGRFTKPFNLVNHITKLYNLNGGTTENPTTKSEVVNNEITYNYATNVGLMKDRLGGTFAIQDSGNIRYYGAKPNNYIDIGDKTEVETAQGNWVSLFGNMITSSEQCQQQIASASEDEVQAYTGMSKTEFCSVSTVPAGTPILWRIIGVFDGKLRIMRDDSIGYYSWDTSAADVNSGGGINQWGPSGNYEGADLMKLLNPGYETNQDLDYEGNTVTVNNSLYWNSGNGYCYNWDQMSNHWEALACDFTNTGLSEEAKEYVIDQTLYLGGFDSSSVFANQAYTTERSTNVIQNPEDEVTRTLTWTGKVGLLYPSDIGYAVDFSNSNCQGNYSTLNSCTESWISIPFSWTISSKTEAANLMVVTYYNVLGYADTANFNMPQVWPTLLLDSSALAESGNGSKETPYVVAY